MNDKNSAHVVPSRTLVAVWVGLLCLTGLTVAASTVDLGPLNIWAALGIASAKSALVVAFFMHMKYERPLLKWLLLIALATLAIFIGLTFFDVLYR